MSNQEQFNEPQTSRLLANFKYADKLLRDIEEILTAASSETAFPKYKNALSPTQVRIVRDYMTRIRRQMLRVLRDLNVPMPAPPFDSVHAIRVTLQFVFIALEECSPERLVGYGHVAEALIAPLTGALQEMKAMVGQLDAYVAQGLGRDLEGRLQRLSGTGNEIDLVRRLRQVIDEHGLVEFRGVLASIVEKLESPGYEIAVFGRVSSGKSSLLNRIIGLDVLPVGVTPVTAVPTRIKNGETERLCLWFAAGRQEQRPIQDLDAFVTEEENPANEKQVTKVLLEIASPRLPAGVTLVDTPGLGSLALSGAAQTLAYLPKCDLGVVVVDASSSITPEDIGTVHKLYDAATPALIVLSKIDLVSEAERARLVNYTARKIQQELGINIPVSPLSSRGEFDPLLAEWMKQEIAPRYARAQELAQESVKRKAGALRESVVAVLEAMSGRDRSRSAQEDAGHFRDVESGLRLAAGQMETLRDKLFEHTDRIRDIGPYIPSALAEEAISRWKANQLEPALDEIWVGGQVVDLAKSEGAPLIRLMQTTADNLTNALDAAGRILPGNHSEDRVDLSAFVKNMPVPEPKLAPFVVKRPLLLNWGLGVARWQVERELRVKTGAKISEFFTDYGRLLELWVRTTLSDVEQRFEQQAESYRAQLQRMTALAGSPQADRSSVAASLELLNAPALMEEPLNLT